MKKQLLVSGLATVSVLMSGMAAAQAVGKVLSSTPVTKKVTEPRTTCTNDADGKQQCETKSVTENRTIAYNVAYEYAGQKYTARLSYQPGPTIELDITPRAVTPAKTAAPAKPQVKPQMQAQAKAKPQAQAQAKPQPSYSAESQPSHSAEAPRTYSSSPPAYSSQSAEVVERHVREPAYVEPYVEPYVERYVEPYVERAYYPRTYYSSSYYSTPQSYYSPRSYYTPRSYYSSSYYDPLYPVVGLALGYTVGRYGSGWRGSYGYRYGYPGYRGPGRGW